MLDAQVRKASAELVLSVRKVDDGGVPSVQRVWSIRRAQHNDICQRIGLAANASASLAAAAERECGLGVGVFNDKLPSDVASKIISLGAPLPPSPHPLS